MEEQIVTNMGDIENAPNDTVYKVIDGFEPGKKLRIGSITAADFIEWQESREGDPDLKRVGGLLLIYRSLVGPEPGNARYANDPKHVATFKRKNHATTERIVREIIALNDMTLKQETASKNA